MADLKNLPQLGIDAMVSSSWSWIFLVGRCVQLNRTFGWILKHKKYSCMNYYYLYARVFEKSTSQLLIFYTLAPKTETIRAKTSVMLVTCSTGNNILKLLGLIWNNIMHIYLKNWVFKMMCNSQSNYWPAWMIPIMLHFYRHIWEEENF